MPSGSENDDKEYLKIETTGLKLMSDYTGLNFNEVIQLDCYTYRCLLRDAITHKYSQSKEGREYLEMCWALTQTAPQRKDLKEKWGGQNKER